MAFAARVTQFTGEQPRLDTRLLPSNASSASENVILTSGRLDPMFSPVIVAQTGRNSTGTIYRMSLGATQQWLSWAGDVDVAKSPVSGDATLRVSFTSDAFEPRQTNLAMAASAVPAPGSWVVLGVAPPVLAPVVSVTGGTGTTTESRSYINTFVTAWGEESAPSAPSAMVAGMANGSWSVTGMDLPPPSLGTLSAAVHALGVVTITMSSTAGLRAGEYVTVSGVLGMTDLNRSHRLVSVTATTVSVSLTTAQVYTSGGTWLRDAPHNTSGMTRRIYRTAVGSSGTAFMFVAEIAATLTSYTDVVAAAALGEPCPSVNWLQPPTDLRGVTTLPNGSTVGFSGNDLCFSEPYRAYAWPVANRLSTDFPIVGVGAYGQSVVVGTTGTPYIATGVDPASMTLEQIAEAWPCVSKLSMTSFGGSVHYASSVGLVSLGSGGVRLASSNMFSQWDWTALNPASFIAAHFDGVYYTMYTVAGVTKILSVSPATGVTRINEVTSTLHSDAEDGKMYGVVGGNIVDMMPTSGVKVPVSWVSKEYVVPSPINLSAAQVNARFTASPAAAAAIAAANAAVSASNAAAFAAGVNNSITATTMNAVAVNSTQLQPLVPVDSVTFTLMVNGAPVYSTVVDSNAVFRLPSLGKYDSFGFAITGTVEVNDVCIAESVEALKGV